MATKITPGPSLLHLNLLEAADRHKLLQSTIDTTLDLLKIAILFVVAKVVLSRLIERLVVPVLNRSSKAIDQNQAARLTTMASLLKSVVNYILIFIAGVMVLRAFRMDPIPLLTTASVAGFAVGFGSQKLVKDVISGFFILLENQYAIGDYVTIGAATGVVEEVGMRTTRIRDDAGKLYILSNGDISLVCNQSRGAFGGFVEIGVASAADIAKATELIDSAGTEISQEHPEFEFEKPPFVQGLAAYDGAKNTLRVACQMRHPSKLSEAQLALRSLIYRKLTENEIPLA